MIDAPPFREHVDKGVELLDREVPDWRDRVDPVRLDMERPCDCILGQVYDEGPFALAGYQRGLRALGLDELGVGWNMVAAQHGFTVNITPGDRFPITGSYRQAWIALRAEWLRRLP